MQVRRADGVGFVQGRNKTSIALSATNRALKKILTQLSSAQRINGASDDAAGLSISEILKSQVRGFKSASRNIQDAVSALNITDGTSREIGSILQRQRELALKARTDTITNDQRASIDKEFQMLQKEIGRIASSSTYNGQSVANGEELARGNAHIQVGPKEGDKYPLPPIDLTINGLGLSGLAVNTRAAASDSLSKIDTALDELNTQRAIIGAGVNRLSSTINNLEVSQINTQAAESVIRDQDMASGLIELTRRKLLREGALAAFDRFNDISANHVMSLLQ